ncbi:hypothetical protein COS54_02115 [Candidatus Shapirobacteria bacterium CG03_land_8_20_14_0_80_39_12]|uniref:PDZ domain-containing protein n=1 Tax=Candidatus Shapirobacteria bacterium CG03_land_8_20_14_0_80_39_12 TaxID=1974879 RepID=A0A2M7BCN6_9BACT|nr:MAG: hypothetical protein COS54_02115 [Candidatus Shapirobacteria bacterium CG03_land_8_20_14_0_80_39_12]
MKLTLKQIRSFFIGLIILLLGGFLGYFASQKQIFVKRNSSSISNDLKLNFSSLKPAAKMDLFWEVWDKVSQSYLGRKDLDPKKMVYGAISGMVASLGDPYTVFLPPSDNKEVKADLRGDFEGVGIQIGFNKDQRVTVIAPLAGTPADAAGLKSGDVILKIVDVAQKVNKDTAGMALQDAVDLIRGAKGTSVTLTIGREGLNKPFDVNLKRETIVVKSVNVKFVEKEGKEVAILTLSRFGDRTDDEWAEAVKTIKAEEAKKPNFSGVILNLRNNPGGYLDGAVFIGSEFLSSGPVVLQDRGADGKETYSVNRQGQLLREPLIVLINGGSASASEIVAGALQEAKRAKLVGEKSFGKGTVQEAQDLEGGAGLHVTVARWLTPSGKSIDKEGIKPDFEVKPEEKDQTKDLQMQKAIDLLMR